MLLFKALYFCSVKSLIVMRLERHNKIATIVSSDFKQVLLLEHLGISLVVGEKTVQEVCDENHINPDLYLCFASLFHNQPLPQVPHFNENDVQTMVRYLQNSHRYYQTERIPKLQNYIQILSQQNQSQGSKLLENFVQNYINEITEHFEYENNVVFPYMLSLASHQAPDSTYSVIDYKEQHHNIDEALADIKGLLVKYLPINEDEKLRRKLLNCLFDLEHDLIIHSQIEDHLLIPLVEKFEANELNALPNNNVQIEDKKNANLSEREIAVLRLLLEGFSNKEVADKLHISTHTVISHRKNITQKIGIKSLAGLTIYALQNNLIQLTQP